MSDPPKTRCFVIMPFSDTENHPEKYWTSHYEKFLKPLIEGTGNIEVSRSQAIRGGITTRAYQDYYTYPSDRKISWEVE